MATCFVLMPFEEPFNSYYEDILKPAIREAGLEPKRADEIYGVRPIIDDIFSGIRGAAVLVADVTGKNPNVNYELGIAHALEKPVVIISQSVADIPFDYRQIRTVLYNTKGSKWPEKLRQDVTKTIQSIDLHQQNNQEVLCNIINKGSGKYLEVADGSQKDGGRVQQWDYHGGDNQVWILRPQDKQYSCIVAKHSGKCLDVTDRSVEDGIPLQQWDFINNNNQHWTFLRNKDGTYQIIARHSHRCLDVLEASSDNGASIVQFPWHGGDNQRWWLNLLVD